MERRGATVTADPYGMTNKRIGNGDAFNMSLYLLRLNVE